MAIGDRSTLWEECFCVLLATFGHWANTEGTQNLSTTPPPPAPSSVYSCSQYPTPSQAASHGQPTSIPKPGASPQQHVTGGTPTASTKGAGDAVSPPPSPAPSSGTRAAPIPVPGNGGGARVASGPTRISAPSLVTSMPRPSARPAGAGMAGTSPNQYQKQQQKKMPGFSSKWSGVSAGGGGGVGRAGGRGGSNLPRPGSSFISAPGSFLSAAGGGAAGIVVSGLSKWCVEGGGWVGGTFFSRASCPKG